MPNSVIQTARSCNGNIRRDATCRFLWVTHLIHFTTDAYRRGGSRRAARPPAERGNEVCDAACARARASKCVSASRNWESGKGKRRTRGGRMDGRETINNRIITRVCHPRPAAAGLMLMQGAERTRGAGTRKVHIDPEKNSIWVFSQRREGRKAGGNANVMSCASSRNLRQ